MEISELKRDAARIDGGQWVGEIQDMGDLRLKVRGEGYLPFLSMLQRKIRAMTRSEKMPDGSPKPEPLLKATGEAAHAHLLIDWDGLTDEGKPLPYDREIALKWLTDPVYVHFSNAVAWAARQVERGAAEVKEVAGKN